MSDVLDPPVTAPARRPRPWVHDSGPTRRWDATILAWCLLGLGAGSVLGGILARTVPTLGGFDLATTAFWAALAVPVVLALRRGIPRGLLRFRWLDVLYGVVLGVLLRLFQGSLAVAMGASPALPAIATLDGGVPAPFWLTTALSAAVAAPVVEEFFFRGALLVAVYLLVRRFAGGGRAGGLLAGVVSVLATTGLFVLAHVLVAAVAADGVISLAVFGLVAGGLVWGTRRLWPAVVLHVVYNGMLVGLTAVGTLLG